ncbi:fibronectin type III domain-containing protein [uncultured Porphyromonas sp.]|uniref:fibronectin type III domain-containing protein n=1 Tax=uncultured Porphyromonas sp. TaxID=159274 RepID=UPI00262F999E|nr:fibronectin type III domain-containing protein [uncultured Porphyromonas sp.]
MKFKNILSTLSLLLVFSLQSPSLLAQELSKELLNNGGLEKYYRKTPLEGDEPQEEHMWRKIYPHHWRFDDTLAGTKVRGGHSGGYCILFYLNGGSISYHDNDYSQVGHIPKNNIIPIEAGGEYQCSFWYRGDYVFRAKVCVVIEWYKDDQLIKKDTSFKQFKYYVPKVGDHWQQHTISEIKAPAGGNKAAFSLVVEGSEGSKFYIDDISFMQVKRGEEVPQLPAPANLSSKVMQHEVTLTWRAIAEPGVTYQILCDGEPIGETTETSFIHKHRKANTTYSYSVKSIKGSLFSRPSDAIKVRTEGYRRSPNDPTRVPHLYMITKDGEAPRQLPLFYTDLILEGAEIKYHLNGQEVIPSDDLLQLEPGEHTLIVFIQEKDREPIELTYFITVK